MARFRIPTFVLPINIYTNVTGIVADDVAAGARLAAVPCNLAYGRRVNVASTGGTGSAGIPLQAMNALVPAGTDIRGPQGPGTMPDAVTGVIGDYVEAPAGSGRFYVVTFVDDIGKGFPNEHRTAGIFAVPGSWTAPYP
jgi:hypothetical protein